MERDGVSTVAGICAEADADDSLFRPFVLDDTSMAGICAEADIDDSLFCSFILDDTGVAGICAEADADNSFRPFVLNNAGDAAAVYRSIRVSSARNIERIRDV